MTDPPKLIRDPDVVQAHSGRANRIRLASVPSVPIYTRDEEPYLPIFAGVDGARARRKARKRERGARRAGRR